MAEKKIEKCAHPVCNCPAAPGSKFCGSVLRGVRESSVYCVQLKQMRLAIGRSLRHPTSSGARLNRSKDYTEATAAPVAYYITAFWTRREVKWGPEDCRGTKFAQPSWLQQVIRGNWPCRICAWATTHYLRHAHHWPSSVICVDQQALLSIGPVQPNAQCRGVAGRSYK